MFAQQIIVFFNKFNELANKIEENYYSKVVTKQCGLERIY